MSCREMHEAWAQTHLARDNLRIRVLRLNEKLNALNGRGGGLRNSTSNTACAEVNQKLDSARLLRWRRRNILAAGSDELRIQRMGVAEFTTSPTTPTRASQRFTFHID